MKYARLTLSDLKDLEKEFIEFLIVNGIAADEWEAIKKEDKEKTEKIIDQFSDVVWESILRKNKLVEKRSKDQLTVCYVENDELITLFIKSNTSKFDLTKTEDIDELIAHKNQLQIQLKKDQLTIPAPQQLFQLLQVGFYFSKNEKYIDLIKAEQNR